MSFTSALPIRRTFSSSTSSRRPALLARRWKTGTCSWKVDPVTGVVSLESKPMYQVKVGLEIHAQLNVKTKLFSPAASPAACGSSLYLPANDAAHHRLHPFDVAVPGTLPALSGRAVRAAVLAAAALRCRLRPTSRFERKHYCYADLPHGYQITQQRWPLAVHGEIVFDGVVARAKAKSSEKKGRGVGAATTSRRRCRVNRIQLEQDTGKTTTVSRAVADDEADGSDAAAATRCYSRVDFNRAGAALIEIVTEPDLRSSLEAAAAVNAVRRLLRHAGACGGRMEEGQLRVDCNVNLVSARGDAPATGSSGSSRGSSSPRVEIKNLNSVRQVEQAIAYEAVRHADLLHRRPAAEDGFVPETRTWSVTRSRTELIRRKDQEQDYRFLPEPDLPPLVLNESVLGGLSVEEFVQRNLPELPSAAVERLVDGHGLSEYQASVIAGDPPAIALFDAAVEKAIDVVADRVSKRAVAATTANLLTNELFALIKENALEGEASVEQAPVSAQQLSELVVMLLEESISATQAKKLLGMLFSEDELQAASPRQVAADWNIQLLADPRELREICRTVIADNPQKLEVYRRGGKFVTKMEKLFMGKCMSHSGNNAHPERLREALLEVLEEVAPGIDK